MIMHNVTTISRRGMLGIAAGVVLGAKLAAAKDDPPVAGLPVSPLGKTGRSLPRLGIGCFPLGNLEKEDDAVAVLHRAFDLGVRYLDTAPSYGAGRSEQRVGLALETWLKAHPGVGRGDFYIATKTLRRDGIGAAKELEQSLRNLRTAYVDAVQCHEVHDDWETLFAKDGVVEALENARRGKLMRFVGITGHRNPAYVLNAIRRYPPTAEGAGFVTALVPVNPIDVQHMSFVRGFLPVAAELGVAVVAMKVYGGGFLLETKDDAGGPRCSAADLLRYALAQPAVAVAVPGCDRVSHVEQANAAMVGFQSPDAAWLQALEKRMPKHEGKSTEWYPIVQQNSYQHPAMLWKFTNALKCRTSRIQK